MQLPILAGMLQAPGRVQLWQLLGIQGREEQLVRQLMVGRQQLYGMVLEGAELGELASTPDVLSLVLSPRALQGFISCQWWVW